MAIDLQIHDNHLHFNGVNYFRGKADGILLGDVGDKKTPSTQENYLEVQGNVVRKNLKIHSASRIDMQGIDVSSADIGIGLQVPGVGTLSAGTVATQLKDQTLSLLKLSVLPSTMVDLANAAESKALTPLIQAGNSGRMVHEVFVILQAKTAVTFETATRFDVSGVVGALTITASGGVGGSSGATVTVNPGGTFAYLLLKPKWDANQQKNWTRIVGSEDDQWSLY